MAHSCNMLRRVLVRTGTIAMRATPPAVVDQFQPTGEEWRTEPCGSPLFADEERARGTCRACASGWFVPENYPLSMLNEFRATGRDCADLEAAGCETGAPEGEPPRAGRIYGPEDSGLHIDGEPGAYCLTIENDSHMGALADLEAELFQWALDSGHFEGGELS